MITSAKKVYKKKPNKNQGNGQNPRTNGKSKAIKTKSHKVHRFNFGMIHCLF